MVNKKPPQPSKKSPVIAEPALANRPKRNISPKSWDNSSVLSWREEQELKKALYASLHEVKRQASDPGEQTAEVKEIKTNETRHSRESTPQYKKSRSVSLERNGEPHKSQAVETRRHSAGSVASVSAKKNGKGFSEERELRSRTRLSSPGTSRPVKLETQISTCTTNMTDETSQDSINSFTSNAPSQENKRKFRAQRKFAQMHGYGYGYCYTPSTTPVKRTTGGSTAIRTPPIKVFPKRAKTEDFLTFLCLRGTHALPPHLDMYNFSREDSNGADSSCPATPSNGRRTGSSVRESSPSSSSTSVSQDDGFCPISPLKTLMTPIKKAARASAGTPEIARGLAIRTRHTKNSQRTAFGKSLDITPVKSLQSSPGKRKSHSTLSPKGSPSKMPKSDRIKSKRKALATLTTLEKKSRKKSLFSDDSGEGAPMKKVKFSSDVDVVFMDTNICPCSLSDCSACNPTKLSVMTTNGETQSVVMTTNGETQSVVMTTNGETQSVDDLNKQSLPSIDNSNFVSKFADYSEESNYVNVRDKNHHQIFVENEMLLHSPPLTFAEYTTMNENVPVESVVCLKQSIQNVMIGDENNNVDFKNDQISGMVAAFDNPISSDLLCMSWSTGTKFELPSASSTSSSEIKYANLPDVDKSENKRTNSVLFDASQKSQNVANNDLHKSQASIPETIQTDENMNTKSTSDCNLSKLLHVKCKDFPTRASTCIVPKPPPPYSLIKAMRQLENSDFGISSSKSCNHSICYHSTNCCHSNEPCMNNILTSSTSISGNLSRVASGRTDTNNNSNGCFVPTGPNQVLLDNRKDEPASKLLYPLPPTIMSTYMH